VKPKVKFALTLVVLFVLILGAIAGGFLVAWPTLSDPEKTLIAGIYAERVGLFVLFGVFLLGGAPESGRACVGSNGDATRNSGERTAYGSGGRHGDSRDLSEVDQVAR
jgi:hypothetical protein